MSRRAPLIIAIVGLNVIYLGLSVGDVRAQDAQAEATAKATKHQAATDSTRSAVEIATPTDVGTTPRTSAPTAADTEKLKRRAGEQAGDGPSGRTLILGMHVKEADDGGVQVAEVGLETPASEAGIRKGDKIISFQDFHANNYRKWIDGIRRLATGAHDGSMLTVVVMRDGNPVTTKVRVPANQVGPIQLPLGQPPAPQASQPNANGPAAPNGGDSNVNVQGNAAITNFFSGDTETASERAVAELFHMGPGHKVSESAANDESNQPGEPAPPLRGSRVGFAGFRNDANGMLVMVDVGGMEPGNYTVGISDPSVIGDQARTARPVVNTPAPGQTLPIAAPATGSAGPTNTPPAGQSNAATSQGAGSNETPNPAESPAPLPNDLGTITIDQSGTGRMQHVVEGVRVRNVVGQVLVIYSSTKSPTATLPPNLDPTADPGTSKSQPSSAVDPEVANQRTAAASTSGAGAQPVVAGVIRLLSDKAQAPTGNAQVRPGAPEVGQAPNAPANPSRQ